MSTSPTPPTNAPSQKRPLEEPSSESGIGDQPEAKRPALENLVKEEGTNGPKAVLDTETDNATPAENGSLDAKAAVDKDTLLNGAANGQPEVDSANQDLQPSAVPSAAGVLETQPIQSTTSSNANANSQGAFVNQHQDETGWLHVRSIISSAEAATVIGKGGENVTLIRRMSGAKCTVSDYARGAVERVLTVSGLVDAVAKAFGLIIRTLNNEPIEKPSTAQSKTYPLRLLIPHILIGSIIGQKGIRIREIQVESGARLNVSDSCLPLSTERTLVVLGVADAVHIATYYVGSTLVEQLTERFGGPAASAYATRSGGPAGVVPGGMQVVPYTPQPVGGQWGHPDSYRRHTQQIPPQQRGPSSSFGMPYAQHGQANLHQPQLPMPYGTGSPSHVYSGVGGHAAQPYNQQHPQQQSVPHTAAAAAPQPMGGVMPGQPLTQQIFIPNDMVGAIIGKGGAKINEIRQLSGSVIKINEPQDNSNERLVTITGTQECNQMALYMLYQRLESEKHRI